jgi:hypothetical protein
VSSLFPPREQSDHSTADTLPARFPYPAQFARPATRWTRQWAAIDPHVEPTAFTPLPDGRVEVTVDQLVRSLDGDILVDGTVQHVYAFRDGKVSGMDVMEPRAATGTAPA